MEIIELFTKQIDIVQSLLNVAKQGDIKQEVAISAIAQLSDVNGAIMEAYDKI